MPGSVLVVDENMFPASGFNLEGGQMSVGAFRVNMVFLLLFSIVCFLG